MLLRAYFLQGYIKTHYRACSGEKSGDCGRSEILLLRTVLYHANSYHITESKTHYGNIHRATEFSGWEGPSHFIGRGVNWGTDVPEATQVGGKTLRHCQGPTLLALWVLLPSLFSHHFHYSWLSCHNWRLSKASNYVELGGKLWFGIQVLTLEKYQVPFTTSALACY